jgi:hypothetical protein
MVSMIRPHRISYWGLLAPTCLGAGAPLVLLSSRHGGIGADATRPRLAFAGALTAGLSPEPAVLASEVVVALDSEHTAAQKLLGLGSVGAPGRPPSASWAT